MSGFGVTGGNLIPSGERFQVRDMRRAFQAMVAHDVVHDAIGSRRGVAPRITLRRARAASLGLAAKPGDECPFAKRQYRRAWEVGLGVSSWIGTA